MGLRPNDFLIDDETLLLPAVKDAVYRYVSPDGVLMGKGQEPRNMHEYPIGFAGPPSEIKLIPRSEWSARIKEKEERKSFLSDIVKAARCINLNQKTDGYCWMYSSGHAITAIRAKNNQPYRLLSPHGPAAIIKNGRDEGGWCGLAMKYLREHGMPDADHWPLNSRSLSNKTPEMLANAKQCRVTEEYYDVAKAEYDQTMTFDMVASLLLSDIPTPSDFNWWGHSVCSLDLVEVEANSFGLRIWNSWGELWGEGGFGVLRDQKAIPNAAVAVRAVIAAA